MLSRRDQRALNDIEGRLRDEAPDLDRLLMHFDRRETARSRERRRYLAWTLFGIAATLIGFAYVAHSSTALLLGGLALIADGAAWITLAGLVMSKRWRSSMRRKQRPRRCR